MQLSYMHTYLMPCMTIEQGRMRARRRNESLFTRRMGRNMAR